MPDTLLQTDEEATPNDADAPPLAAPAAPTRPETTPPARTPGFFRMIDLSTT